MTYGELKSFVKKMNDERFVAICKDVYDWRYEFGMIQCDSELDKMITDLNFTDTRYVEDAIVAEAHEKPSERNRV